MLTALGGLSVFGTRTKELAETAKTQIGESAQSAQKAIGETSTGKKAFDVYRLCPSRQHHVEFINDVLLSIAINDHFYNDIP